MMSKEISYFLKCMGALIRKGPLWFSGYGPWVEITSPSLLLVWILPVTVKAESCNMTLVSGAM